VNDGFRKQKRRRRESDGVPAFFGVSGKIPPLGFRGALWRAGLVSGSFGRFFRSVLSDGFFGSVFPFGLRFRFPVQTNEKFDFGGDLIFGSLE
jgi:hypothetical protein